MRLISLISFYLACGVVGFETGWLTGHTGPDAAVLAAVLPVILGAFIGSIGMLAVRSNSKVGKNTTKAVVLPVLVLAPAAIVFTLMVHVGIGLGVDGLKKRQTDIRTQAVEDRTAHIQAEIAGAEERLEKFYDYISACTEVWTAVNEIRTAAELEPLTLAESCIALPSSGFGRPLELPLTGAFDALLTEDALKLHRRYLVECTELQRASRAESKDRRQTIGDVCPALVQG